MPSTERAEPSMVLRQALERIAARCSTEDPNYTVASVGDTARMALAAVSSSGAGDAPVEPVGVICESKYGSEPDVLWITQPRDLPVGTELYATPIKMPDALSDSQRLDWLEQFYSDTARDREAWKGFMRDVAAEGFRAAIERAVIAQKGKGENNRG